MTDEWAADVNFEYLLYYNKFPSTQLTFKYIQITRWDDFIQNAF